MDKYLGFVGKDFGHSDDKEHSTIIRAWNDIVSSSSAVAQGIDTDRFGDVVCFLQ